MVSGIYCRFFKVNQLFIFTLRTSTKSIEIPIHAAGLLEGCIIYFDTGSTNLASLSQWIFPRLPHIAAHAPGDSTEKWGESVQKGSVFWRGRKCMYILRKYSFHNLLHYIFYIRRQSMTRPSRIYCTKKIYHHLSAYKPKKSCTACCLWNPMKHGIFSISTG